MKIPSEHQAQPPDNPKSSASATVLTKVDTSQSNPGESNPGESNPGESNPDDNAQTGRNLPAHHPASPPAIYRWLLILTCAGVFGVLGKSLIAPGSVQRKALPPVQFLATVPLPDWQATDSQASERSYRYEYRYKQAGVTGGAGGGVSAGVTGGINREAEGDRPLNASNASTPVAGPITLTITLEEVNAFTANSNRFQRDAAIARTYDPNQPQVRQQPGQGSYVLSRDRTHTTLTACITPQGKSVGSDADYWAETHRQRFAPMRLLAWAIGTGRVRDARCLWSTLSIPQTQTPPDTADPLLEQAWQNWFPVWKRALPPS